MHFCDNSSRKKNHWSIGRVNQPCSAPSQTLKATPTIANNLQLFSHCSWENFGRAHQKRAKPDIRSVGCLTLSLPFPLHFVGFCDGEKEIKICSFALSALLQTPFSNSGGRGEAKGRLEGKGSGPPFQLLNFQIWAEPEINRPQKSESSGADPGATPHSHVERAKAETD